MPFTNFFFECLGLRHVEAQKSTSQSASMLTRQAYYPCYTNISKAFESNVCHLTQMTLLSCYTMFFKGLKCHLSRRFSKAFETRTFVLLYAICACYIYKNNYLRVKLGFQRVRFLQFFVFVFYHSVYDYKVTWYSQQWRCEKKKKSFLCMFCPCTLVITHKDVF